MLPPELLPQLYCPWNPTFGLPKSTVTWTWPLVGPEAVTCTSNGPSPLTSTPSDWELASQTNERLGVRFRFREKSKLLYPVPGYCQGACSWNEKFPAPKFSCGPSPPGLVEKP